MGRLHTQLLALLPHHWRSMVEAGVTIQITQDSVKMKFPRGIIRMDPPEKSLPKAGVVQQGLVGDGP